MILSNVVSYSGLALRFEDAVLKRVYPSNEAEVDYLSHEWRKGISTKVRGLDWSTVNTQFKKGIDDLLGFKSMCNLIMGLLENAICSDHGLAPSDGELSTLVHYGVNAIK